MRRSVPSLCLCLSSRCGDRNFQLEGIGTGKYAEQLIWYRSEGACQDDRIQNATMVTNRAGHWTDLGPAPINQRTRIWELRTKEDGFSMMPMDPSTVSILNARCRCNGTWSLAVARNLTMACPCTMPLPFTSKGTTITGGEPFFRRATVSFGRHRSCSSLLPHKQLHVLCIRSCRDHDCLLRLLQLLTLLPVKRSVNNNSVFTITRGVSSFAAAVRGDSDDRFLTINKTRTCFSDVLANASLCGEWSLRCVHTSDSPGVVQAKTGSFTYKGPENALFEAGLYGRTTTWYSDLRCSSPYVSVEIATGTFKLSGTSSEIRGGFVAQEFPSALSVTPWDLDALREAQNDCPCGDGRQWVIGRPRIITSCPDVCHAWW